MPIRLNFGQGGGYQKTFDVDAWLEEKKRKQAALDQPAEPLEFLPENIEIAREMDLGPVPAQPSTVDKIGQAFHENPLLRALSIASTGNILSRAEQGLLEKAGYAKSPLIVEPETRAEKALGAGAGLAVDAYIGGKVLKAIAPTVGGGAKKAVDMVKGLPTGVQAAGGAAAALGAAKTAQGAFTPNQEAGDRSFLEQTGASLRYGTGQLLETAGGIAKWRDWEEIGESLGTTGQKIKEGYETEPQEFSWRSFFDPDFYAVNVAQSLPMTLSLIPAMYGGYKLGGSAGAKMGLNTFQKAILASITGAGVSRPLESAMEAGSTYEECIARGMDPEKAEQAANSVFKKNLSLVGLDAAQLAGAFAPWKGLQATTKLGKIGLGAGKLGFEALTEAGEEGIQEVFQRQAMGDPIAFDPQMKEAMAIGGLFGAGMGGAGVIKDTYESIRERTIDKMPEEMKTQVNHHIQTEVANGTPPDQAMDKALDAIAETEEGKQVIAEAVQEINEEVKSGRAVIMPYAAREEKYGTLTDKRSMVTGAEGISGPPVVYDTQGRKWIVLDDTSDPARIKVQSENGATTWLGRKVVSTEPPAGASPAKTEIEAPQEIKPPATGQRQPAETGQAGVSVPAGETNVPQTGANIVEQQPWEMTREEFIDWSAGKTGLNPDVRSMSGIGTHREIWERGHKVLVKKALSGGKPVSAKVLKDYPELVAKHKEQAAKKELKEFEFEVSSLKASYKRHKELMEKGGSDPGYPDGSNMDLVRNHIIYHKRRLKELSEKHGLKLPEEYDLPLPAKVPSTYMAPGSKSGTTALEGKPLLDQLSKHQQDMPKGLFLHFYNAGQTASGKVVWEYVRYDGETEHRSKSFGTPEEAVKAAKAESAAKPEKKEEARGEQSSERAKIERDIKIKGAASRKGVSVRIVPHDEEEGMFGVEITKDGNREGPHRVAITLEHAQRRAVGILFAGEHPDAKTPWDTEEIIEARVKQKATSSTHLINTPERKQLRRQKQSDLYRTGAPKKERKAWLVMGPPASGKSTLSDPLVKETGSLLIDADEAKKILPEYNDGKGADAVHEESSQIAYALFEQAAENGDNMVVPIVGRTMDGLHQRIKLLKDCGYEINIIMVDLPIEKAAQRAITRYYNEGRFVDPDYVYNKVALNPRENYVNLELEGGCDSYEAYSTDIPRGEEPPRIKNPAHAWGMSDVRGKDARRSDSKRVPGTEGRGAVRGDGSQTEGKDESQRSREVITGNTTTAKTERGTSVEAKYAVVPIGDLIASHNIDLSKNEAYPEEIQPRQRERAASEEQINRIAANLEPEFLGESPKASEGAPIVGPDMVVESGNGRIIALMRVYKRLQKNAEKYKTWLVDNAEKFGLDKEAIGEIKNPVLVRIRQTEVDRAAFAREANEQSVASMSATEQAKADAEKLTGDILNYFVPSETGEIHRLANADFIRNFMEKVVGPSERGRYVTADGELSQEGITRIKNAIFAKAYGDVTAIAKLAESTDNNVKNITNAMLIAAPKLAKVKEGIGQGDLPDLDISVEVAAAMKKLSHLREAGDTAENYLNQVTMFERELSDIARDLLDVFNKNKRHTKRLAGILKNYADMITTLGDPKQVTMFSKTNPTKAELLLASIRKVEKESGETNDQTSLFQDQTVRSETSGENDGRKPEETGGPKPYKEIAEFVERKLNKKEKITSVDLFRAADKAYGGTQAQGKYTPKDAYDAMELGVNMYLDGQIVIDPKGDIDAARSAVKNLVKMLELLPTQTRRTGETDDFQQFSTPPPLAYIANWAANLNTGDVVLEPSAGIGGLALFANTAGADVIMNEITPRRAALLKELAFGRIFTEDAEQLNNILPDYVKPTVVVMNPPFSAAAGRMKGVKKTSFAEAHLEQALLRLQPDGRLVAIVGRGMADKAPAFRNWWKKIKAEYNVRANIGINGSNYTKYGTSFDVQILVIDKTGATPEGSTITGIVTKLEDALPLLEGVRNDRAVNRQTEQAPDQSDHAGETETGEGKTGSGSTIPPSTSGLGAENRGGKTGKREPSGGSGKTSVSGSAKGHGSSSQAGTGGRRGPLGGTEVSSQDQRPGGSGGLPPGQDTSGADSGRGTGTEGDGSARGDSGLNTQSIHDWLNNAEQAAWDRISSRKGRLMAGLPMDDMLDYTIIGAAKLARGMLNMAEFSASMLSDITARFGEAAASKFRPWLPGVYAQSQAMLQMTPEQVEEMLSDVSKDQESEKKPEKKGQKKKQPKEKQEKQEEQEEAPLEEGPLESEISIEEQEEEASEEELTDAVFSDYKPQKLKIPGAKTHPGRLAQSAAMAAVEPPAPTYVPNLPKELIEKGKLSIAQLEAVVYAGQAHLQKLTNGFRRGFFIGDGTGVGKGREISAIILDNWRQGRKKAVWISKNKPLFNDARRDFKGVGLDPGLLIDVGKVKQGEPIKNKEGVIFTTYNTLAQNLEVSRDGDLKVKGGKQARIDQLVEWLGEDFDGVIAFDEAHNMKNSLPTKKGFGQTTASGMALAGVELQKRLPNARIVYVSATGATEVTNLAYADRLGLWGEGTPFPGKLEFVNQIHAGGLATMELVARDMKAMGSYLARSLSYDGVTYGTLQHELTLEQTEIYDAMAEGWQIVLQNIGEALDVTNQGRNGNAKRRALSAFWSAQQRFFNQILTSMQMPSVVESVRKDLADGKAVVMQLVNTNKAIQDRQIANMEEGDSLDDLDLTPREVLMQYLEKSFPTQQYEEYLDDNGNVRTRPVVDSQGRPVHSRQAIAKKEELLSRLGSMKVPEGPLDIILNTFSVENVAEITGRNRRVVRVKDAGGRLKAKSENRTPKHSEADAAAFMDDKKKILIFSNAGGTGRSYHASLAKKNQRKRIHYLIQPGWIADNAVQGFGRTHRTNQAQPPHYVLVTTDLKGQKRFISSIARRLDQLGALTKGQRQTGSQGLFSAKDNLENSYAKDALQGLYTDLINGNIELPGGITGPDLLKKMGMDKLLGLQDETRREVPELRNVTQFLNRILVLESSLQNDVFDAFASRMEELIDRAAAEGTLDVGLENFRADKVRLVDEKTVYTDKSGAETKYVELEASYKNFPIAFEEISRRPDFEGYFYNKRSKRIYAVRGSGYRTLENGRVVRMSKTYGQSEDNVNYIESEKLREGNWVEVKGQKAKEMWDNALEKLPEYRQDKVHLITGAILPIWDRLPDEHVRVIRVKTDDGKIMLGRIISDRAIDLTLSRLNASREKQQLEPAEIVERVIEDGYIVNLANGWRIARRYVSREYRIEIIGDNLWRYAAEFQRDGVFSERINYNTRYFIPTGEEAAEVFAKVTQHRPVVDIVSPEGVTYSSTQQENSEVRERARISYREAKKRLDEKVDETIGDVHPPAGMSVRIVGGRNRNQNAAPSSEYEGIENEEIRERFEAAKGVPRESMREKISELITRLKNMATREFEHLPRTAEFSRLRNDLLNLAKQKGVSSYKTLHTMMGITINFNKKQYNTFRHYVILADLVEEMRAGHDLPFGFDADTLKHEWERVREAVKADPEIQRAVNDRKSIWSGLINDYVAAQEAIGHHVEDKFNRQNYYRHQVLEYAQAKSLTGTGKKLRTPSNRGFLKKREGSALDINTDYLQADYEVMARMLYDIEVANVINRVNKKDNIINQVRDDAKRANKESLDLIIQKEKSANEDGISSTEMALKSFRSRIAMGFSGLRKMAKDGTLWQGENGEYEDVVRRLAGEEPEVEDDAPDRTFFYLSDLLAHGEEGASKAGMILKAVSNRKAFIKDLLGKKYKTWEDVIPDGYTVWQPREGNIFFAADTIPANLVDQLYNRVITELGLKAGDLNKVLVVGGKRPSYVLKEEIAATLDELVKAKDMHPFLQLVSTLQRYWKIWQLVSPRRWFKYNFRNLSGDAEAVFVGNPVGFKKIPQAFKDLYPVFKANKSMPPNMRDWFERGGMETLLQAQELSDINQLEMFARLERNKGKLSELPVRAWQGYWKAARLSTDFREALLRYANYLSYLEQMQRNGGRPNNFGASIPEEAMALDDIKDRAFKLSNELLGAYDQVGVIGQQLRQYLIPFWSWNEVNFRRTKQLFFNAARDGDLARAVGRNLLKTTAVKSPFIAYRVGKFTLKAAGLWVMLQLWNEWKWPEEEKSLPLETRARPHIIFGKDKDGKVIYFDRLGFVQDFLSWFGLDESPLVVRDYLNGKRTLKEIALSMAKSPVNKLVTGLGPIVKTPAELLYGKSSYPDAFKMRSIRDRWQYLADSLGLGNEYKLLAGKPIQTYGTGNRIEGYWKSWEESFIYKADPLQSAYYDILDAKNRYLKEKGEESSGTFTYTPRSNALYNFKLAVRYKDKEAARQALTEYAELGGTNRGLEQSLKTMNPMYGLNKEEQVEFIQYLDTEERGKLLRAIKYYETTLIGK